MDRPTTRPEADARNPRPRPGDPFLLPSRRAVLELCRAAIGSGPILLTGEAGVGKTWLRRKLEDETPGAPRWLEVDLTPADRPADLYRLIGHGLGMVGPGDSGPSRVDLGDFLADRHVEGDRRALAVEEAHNLSGDVWEEIRILANRLGRADGFSALALVGQTALARRFSTRPFASIEARLAARVHLGPIDADEAGELLARLRPARAWSTEEVEAVHRDAGGNPRRILRRVGSIGAIGPAARPSPPPERAEVAPAVVEASPVGPARPSLMGPGKPPLRVEDNLIEVGWEPEDASVFDESGELAALPVGVPAGAEGGEEAVHDHYAALQAWHEWTENQGRRGRPEPEPEPASPDEEAEAEATSPLADRPTLWADGEQRFAPFGQLFSRMTQARDPD